jgi:hypothetical protein
MRGGVDEETEAAARLATMAAVAKILMVSFIPG